MCTSGCTPSGVGVSSPFRRRLPINSEVTSSSNPDGVGQEVVHEHSLVVSRGELGEVFGRRVVDAEQAVFGEHHHQGRGDRLRHRHDVEHAVELDGLEAGTARAEPPPRPRSLPAAR